MNEGDDLHLMLIVEDLIEHAITVKHKELSHVRIAFFGNDAPTPGELPQRSRGITSIADQRSRISR